jgi:hypothetical protein
MVVVVAASAFAPSRVDARVKGPRLNSLSKGCGDLQDEYDQAVRELETASKTGTQAQYDAALAKLVSLIGLWRGSVCEDSFGSIHHMKNPPSQVTGVNVNGGKPTLAPVTPSRPANGKPISPVRPIKGRESSVLKKK